MRCYLVFLLALVIMMGFALSAVAQTVTVDEDDYPHWQITDAVQDRCAPSVAFAWFYALDPDNAYVYTVRMYREAESGEYVGQVYNPVTETWVSGDDVTRLPEFTATSSETAFFVPYRGIPDMTEGDHWLFSVNVALKSVALEGGKFSPDLSLPLTVGSTVPGDFAMGFIEGVEIEGRLGKIASPGPANKILLCRKSPPLGMYVSEDNKIKEGYEDVPDGFFRMAVPARGSVKDDGEIPHYTLEVRDRATNEPLTILEAKAPIPEPGGTTIVDVLIGPPEPPPVEVAIRLTRATGGSKITAGKIGIRAGDPADFAATVTDTAGSPVDEPVIWSVGGEAGTVDEDGHFIASERAGDQGALIATVGGVSDSVFVTIIPNLLKRIEITPPSAEVNPGDRVAFKAQGYDAYGNPLTIRPLWHVTREIGVISSVTGTFIAGETPGSGDVVAFAQAVFGDVSTEVSGSAKVVVWAVPRDFTLHPNAPNPFNPRTTIRYDLPMAGKVTLVVYDLGGRVVRRSVSEEQEVGIYRIGWDGMDERRLPVASGVFLCRLHVRVGLGSDDYAMITRTRKMCLMR